MLFFGFVILVIFPLKHFLPKIYWEFRETKSGLINAITYLSIISGIIFVIAVIFLLINIVHSIQYCLLSSIEISACFSETIDNNLLILYLLSLFLVIIFRILKNAFINIGAPGGPSKLQKRMDLHLIKCGYRPT